MKHVLFLIFFILTFPVLAVEITIILDDGTKVDASAKNLSRIKAKVDGAPLEFKTRNLEKVVFNKAKSKPWNGGKCWETRYDLTFHLKNGKVVDGFGGYWILNSISAHTRNPYTEELADKETQFLGYKTKRIGGCYKHVESASGNMKAIIFK